MAKGKLKDSFKKFKTSFWVPDLLMILVGVFAVIWPNFIQITACYVLGIVVLVYALFHLIGFFVNRERDLYVRIDLIIGLVAAGLGIFMLVKPKVVLSILPFIIGVTLVFNGILGISRTLELRKTNYARWWIAVILSALALAFGIVLMINPFGASSLAMVLIGIALIFAGVSDIWIATRVSKAVKSAQASTELIEVEGHIVSEEDDSSNNK